MCVKHMRQCWALFTLPSWDNACGIWWVTFTTPGLIYSFSLLCTDIYILLQSTDSTTSHDIRALHTTRSFNDLCRLYIVVSHDTSFRYTHQYISCCAWCCTCLWRNTYTRLPQIMYVRDDARDCVVGCMQPINVTVPHAIQTCSHTITYMGPAYTYRETVNTHVVAVDDTICDRCRYRDDLHICISLAAVWRSEDRSCQQTPSLFMDMLLIEYEHDVVDVIIPQWSWINTPCMCRAWTTLIVTDRGASKRRRCQCEWN
jgi:hypothetical protein